MKSITFYIFVIGILLLCLFFGQKWKAIMYEDVSKHEYEMLLANPEIRLFSYGLKLHLRVDLYLLKNNENKTGCDRWGIWFLTGFLNKFPSA